MGEPAAYRVEDRSILLPLYKRLLVEPLLPYVPVRVNPNTITHLGHLINLVGAVVLLVTWPTRGWPFLVAIGTLQAYLWCDHADGAHARRTDQCSPLGELLDHGLDALNVVYISYITAMALDAPPMFWVALALGIPGAGAVTYWEQAQTGVFRLGLLNQVESVTVLCAALFVSALFGPQIWAELSLFGLTMQAALLYWTLSTIVFGVGRNLQRVVRHAGLGAVRPVLGLLVFSAAVLGAAHQQAISTLTAVMLASGVNLYFGTRMLSFRLHGWAPRVEPMLWIFTAILGGLTAWHHLGHDVAAVLGPAFTAVACLVFGALAIRDARAGVLRVASP